MASVRLAVLGACGRMGREVLIEASNNDRIDLTGAVTKKGSKEVGRTLEDFLGIEGSLAIGDDPGIAFAEADVVIDFSVSEQVSFHSELASKFGTGYVCCVTGIKDEASKALEIASGSVVLVHAPNTSEGVNVVMSLAEKLGSVLEDYDVDILEFHHRHKRDAPSGTALSLGERVAIGRGLKHEEVRLEPYQSLGKRPEVGIGYAVLRGGEVVGEHHLIFAGEHDRIELVHKSSGRKIYAKGAIKAAIWSVEHKHSPGLYRMKDVLNLDF